MEFQSSWGWVRHKHIRTSLVCMWASYIMCYMVIDTTEKNIRKQINKTREVNSDILWERVGWNFSVDRKKEREGEVQVKAWGSEETNREAFRGRTFLAKGCWPERLAGSTTRKEASTDSVEWREAELYEMNSERYLNTRLYRASWAIIRTRLTIINMVIINSSNEINSILRKRTFLQDEGL